MDNHTTSSKENKVYSRHRNRVKALPGGITSHTISSEILVTESSFVETRISMIRNRCTADGESLEARGVETSSRSSCDPHLDATNPVIGKSRNRSRFTVHEDSLANGHSGKFAGNATEAGQGPIPSRAPFGLNSDGLSPNAGGGGEGCVRSTAPRIFTTVNEANSDQLNECNFHKGCNSDYSSNCCEGCRSSIVRSSRALEKPNPESKYSHLKHLQEGMDDIPRCGNGCNGKSTTSPICIISQPIQEATSTLSNKIKDVSKGCNMDGVSSCSNRRFSPRRTQCKYIQRTQNCHFEDRFNGCNSDGALRFSAVLKQNDVRELDPRKLKKVSPSGSVNETCKSEGTLNSTISTGESSLLEFGTKSIDNISDESLAEVTISPTFQNTPVESSGDPRISQLASGMNIKCGTICSQQIKCNQDKPDQPNIGAMSRIKQIADNVDDSTNSVLLPTTTDKVENTKNKAVDAFSAYELKTVNTSFCADFTFSSHFDGVKQKGLVQKLVKYFEHLDVQPDLQTHEKELLGKYSEGQHTKSYRIYNCTKSQELFSQENSGDKKGIGQQKSSLVEKETAVKCHDTSNSLNKIHDNPMNIESCSNSANERSNRSINDPSSSQCNAQYTSETHDEKLELGSDQLSKSNWSSMAESFVPSETERIAKKQPNKSVDSQSTGLKISGGIGFEKTSREHEINRLILKKSFQAKVANGRNSNCLYSVPLLKPNAFELLKRCACVIGIVSILLSSSAIFNVFNY